MSAEDLPTDFSRLMDDWFEIASRRASVEPLIGKEYFAASGEQSSVTTKIRLRYESLLADLNTKDRIVHGSDIYNIESVINPHKRNRQLIVMGVLHE